MAVRDDGPQVGLLKDGRRLHLQHGPIDLIISADGDADEVKRAYRQAAECFRDVLPTLAGELPLLRRPCSPDMPIALGDIARHMQACAQVHADQAFVTPMIAVAGAVADHVLGALLTGCRLRRACVNNGGDIALALRQGATFDIGICSNPNTGELAGKTHISHNDRVGGIATSGWRGRSFSLGIADAVTVLAPDAASADAAATLIANAVDLPNSSRVTRVPARELAPDSDLGNRLVTRAVAALSRDEIQSAIACGRQVAERYIAEQHIIAAYLSLQGMTVSCDETARGHRRVGAQSHAVLCEQER